MGDERKQGPDNGSVELDVGLLRRIGRLRELRLLLVIVAFAGAMTVYDLIHGHYHDHGLRFLSLGNINIILRFLATYAIMACGMTVLLVSGGFDLSVGSVAALSAMVAAVVMKSVATEAIWPLAMLIGLATGAGVGLLNGIVVAKAGINAFITTLGTMLIARGLTYVISRGQSLADFGEGFSMLGGGSILGVQTLIIVSLTLVILFDLLLRKNRFFRQNYYIGGNEQAAWLSGIAVNKIKIFNFCLSGALAALAGLLFASRTDSALVDFGEGDELKVITAVIIGGASLAGGKGTVFGAFLGCFLLAMIQPAISLLGIQVDWEKVIVGSILVLAALMDRLGRK